MSTAPVSSQASRHAQSGQGAVRPDQPAQVTAVRSLGRTDYVATWRAMQAFTAERTPEAPDEIWLTEHPSIYTLGLAGRREHLLRDNGIPVLKVDRGGQVTYHGPGQLVAYLLIDLRRRRLGVRTLVRAIEAGVVQLLDSYGVAAAGRADAPGVYVRCGDGSAKIAALGLKIRNGCSYHGLALNFDMDLAPFADIDPCGYRGLAVTQLRDVGVDAPRTEIESGLAAALTAAVDRASSA
ncbi:MAG: lipoyl(octanoyl) transferase LipB [Steroidobacterales bacterium]